MRIRTIAIPTVAALAVLLLPEQATRAEAEFVANFGTVAPDNTPWSEHLNSVKDRIAAESGGRVKMKLFMGGILGDETSMVHDVVRGERMQGGGFSGGAVAEAAGVPILQMIELPYLFQTNEEVDTILDGLLQKPVQDALAKKDLMMTAWAENGWRNFATNGGPPTSPAELAQFKMRSQESKVHVGMYKQFGVQAVPKAISEVIPSLQSGIVDGFDNTPLFAIASSQIDFVTHYTLSWHIYQPGVVVFSKKFYDQLPPDLQTVVFGDPGTESVQARAGVRELEDQLVQQIRDRGKIVTHLTDEQRASFAGPAMNVHKVFTDDHPELKPLYIKVRGKLLTMR